MNKHLKILQSSLSGIGIKHAGLFDDGPIEQFEVSEMEFDSSKDDEPNPRQGELDEIAEIYERVNKYEENRLICEKLKLNPKLIKEIKAPTEEMIFSAMESAECADEIIKYIAKLSNISETVIKYIVKNGHGLKYIKNPSDEVILYAIKHSFREVLQYVKTPSINVIKAALAKNPNEIRHIKNQTEEMQLYAVRSLVPGYGFAVPTGRSGLPNGGSSIRYMKNPTEKVLLEAVIQNEWTIKYAKPQTEELCLAAVKHFGKALQYIDNPSEDVKWAALHNTPLAIYAIKVPSIEMLDYAVSTYENGWLFGQLKAKDQKRLKNDPNISRIAKYRIFEYDKSQEREAQVSKQIAEDDKKDRLELERLERLRRFGIT